MRNSNGGCGGVVAGVDDDDEVGDEGDGVDEDGVVEDEVAEEEDDDNDDAGDFPSRSARS